MQITHTSGIGSSQTLNYLPTPATVDNCIWPSYPVYTYPSYTTNAFEHFQYKIRTVANGFIVKFNTSEYVAKNLEEVFKLIKSFDSKNS